MSDFSLSKRSDDNWKTPIWFFEQLNREFDFDDDPCPLYGEYLNSLKRDWGQRVFMNPPYSNSRAWVKKAYEESQKGKLVVGLLRGDTSTAWFHDWVWGKAEIRFVRGRLKFGNKNYPAPFPSIVAIWDGRGKAAGYVQRTPSDEQKRTEELLKHFAPMHKECEGRATCINCAAIHRRIEGAMVNEEQLKKLHKVMGQEKICSYLKSESGWEGYLPITEVQLENILREAGVKVEEP